MLQINTSQIESLARAGEDRFIASEVERLARDHASMNGTDAPPDAAWVKEGLEIGKQCGLYSEEDHARFNDLRLAEGATFPSESDRETLQDEDLWGWQKLDELEGARIHTQALSSDT